MSDKSVGSNEMRVQEDSVLLDTATCAQHTQDSTSTSSLSKTPHISSFHTENGHNNNNSLLQKPLIHRPLTTYTNLGSPKRSAVSNSNNRLRSVSIGGGTGVNGIGTPILSSCLQSRSIPNSPNIHHHHQFGGPTAYGGLLIPQPPPSKMNHDNMMYGWYPNMEVEVRSADIIPPELSEQRKAMEAASASERLRAKQLEEKELHMTADELRTVLKHERARMGKIQSDLAALRYGTVQSQFQAEVLEEGRINGLMRRVDSLKEEKGRIIVELEREEEMLTNTLQRKLNEVRKEKSVLEKQIEMEKKAHQEMEQELDELRTLSRNAKTARTLETNVAFTEALELQEEMEEEE